MLPRRILVVANCHAPLDLFADSGMERSTISLICALAASAKCKQIQIQVLAHADSLIPDGVELVPMEFPECPQEYKRYGDGTEKYHALAHEAVMLTAPIDRIGPDVIHDNSSTLSMAFRASSLNIPIVKTARLIMAHPAYSILPAEHVRVYLSNFQAQSDQATPLSSCVIPDHIPNALLADSEAKIAAVLSPLPSRFMVSVGRVHRRKGHHIARRIAAAYGFSLVVIGGIPDPEYAASLGDVCLLGSQSHQATRAVIRRAEALIWTPEVPEPGGRVVLEALSSGTRVIGFPFGYLADAASNQPTFQVGEICGLVRAEPQEFRQPTLDMYIDNYLRSYQDAIRICRGQ